MEFAEDLRSCIEVYIFPPAVTKPPALHLYGFKGHALVPKVLSATPAKAMTWLTSQRRMSDLPVSLAEPLKKHLLGRGDAILDKNQARVGWQIDQLLDSSPHRCRNRNGGTTSREVCLTLGQKDGHGTEGIFGYRGPSGWGISKNLAKSGQGEKSK